MIFFFKILGHSNLLLAIIVAAMDMLNKRKQPVFDTLEHVLFINLPFDFRIVDRAVRSYAHQSFIDVLYVPILSAPAALVFLGMALIFFAIAALLRG